MTEGRLRRKIFLPDGPAQQLAGVKDEGCRLSASTLPEPLRRVGEIGTLQPPLSRECIATVEHAIVSEQQRHARAQDYPLWLKLGEQCAEMGDGIACFGVGWLNRVGLNRDSCDSALVAP